MYTPKTSRLPRSRMKLRLTRGENWVAGRADAVAEEPWAQAPQQGVALVDGERERHVAAGQEHQ